MKNNFNDWKNNNIIKSVSLCNTWMCCVPGEGELEIVGLGLAKLKSFWQETVARGRRESRNDYRPNLQSVAQDAQRALAQLPFFFKSKTFHQISINVFITYFPEVIFFKGKAFEKLFKIMMKKSRGKKNPLKIG